MAGAAPDFATGRTGRQPLRLDKVDLFIADKAGLAGACAPLAQQRLGYAMLMKAAAEAIIELARDRRRVGGTVGVMAVLHTWTQQLVYHPHVHCLVTGGGVSDDGRDWHPARRGYLLPTKALARRVRGKLKSLLKKRRPDLVVPPVVWSKPWVVQCTPWGDGAEAVLPYLARYVFRVAITENRIVGLDDAGVTIRHKHRTSNRWRHTRLDGDEFMRRFLQHVLPKGFHKVRYYGLWHPSRRAAAAQARLLLTLGQPAIAVRNASHADTEGNAADQLAPAAEPRICPACRTGYLVHARRLHPKWVRGP
jgi:hypothetical protein